MQGQNTARLGLMCAVSARSKVITHLNAASAAHVESGGTEIRRQGSLLTTLGTGLLLRTNPMIPFRPKMMRHTPFMTSCVPLSLSVACTNASPNQWSTMCLMVSGLPVPQNHTQ